jgi:Flp pilus assembly protein TadG
MRTREITLGDFLPRDDGSAAIEMGILFPLFMLLTTGLVDLGVEMLTMMAVNNAAQAGAAYYVTHPSAASSDILAVLNSASGLTTIKAVPAPTLTSGIITVTASLDYAPLLSWSGNPAKLVSTAIIRIE